jgi:hypothetical protein
LTPAAFAAKWRGVTTTEKASSQSHFIDLCRMLGEPTPHEADPTGQQYAFEKRVSKAGGGEGFADVWKRDFFAWEYKGPHKDLKAAYVQLLAYKDDLGNPPLLITSDLDRGVQAKVGQVGGTERRGTRLHPVTRLEAPGQDGPSGHPPGGACTRR